MAKVKGGKFSGRIGDDVYVDSRTYGHHVRKAVMPGARQHETALQFQNRRTKYLNKLASELNTIFRSYAGSLKASNFYQRLQRHFRNEPLDSRLLLLRQLKGMEMNTHYPLEKWGQPATEVTALKERIAVRVRVQDHPVPGNLVADSYYYEVLLLTWDRTEKAAKHESQYSEWILLNKGKPEFEFLFARPKGTVHWLLSIRLRLGKEETVIENFKADGMQIIRAGSFNKKEQAYIAKLETDKQKQYKKEQEALKTKNTKEPVRVKAKRID